MKKKFHRRCSKRRLANIDLRTKGACGFKSDTAWTTKAKLLKTQVISPFEVGGFPIVLSQVDRQTRMICADIVPHMLRHHKQQLSTLYAQVIRSQSRFGAILSQKMVFSNRLPRKHTIEPLLQTQYYFSVLQPAKRLANIILK